MSDIMECLERMARDGDLYSPGGVESIAKEAAAEITRLRTVTPAMVEAAMAVPTATMSMWLGTVEELRAENMRRCLVAALEGRE